MRYLTLLTILLPSLVAAVELRWNPDALAINLTIFGYGKFLVEQSYWLRQVTVADYAGSGLAKIDKQNLFVLGPIGLVLTGPRTLQGAGRLARMFYPGTRCSCRARRPKAGFDWINGLSY